MTTSPALDDLLAKGHVNPMGGGNPLQRFLSWIAEIIGLGPGELMIWGLGLLVVVGIVFVAWMALAGKSRRALPAQPNLKIDVAALPVAGPPAQGPVLEFYNLPVRLTAVVLAPAGRVRELPTPDKLDACYEALVPGLARVIASHAPLVRRWPAQLSPSGFAHAFFANVKLSGDGGKGTPWCSAAGVVKVQGQPMMIGLLMRTAESTSHGQQIVDTDSQWLGFLRVKQATSNPHS